ncbi:MAG: 6-phosphogluconolactonase [Polyangiales bacterium]|jgi:6-phosphogluconolactonase
MSAPSQHRLVHAGSPVDEAIQLILEALHDVAAPRIAVSGGSAGALVGPLRAALGERWSQVRLTWADERAVPFEHEASNRGALYRSGALNVAHLPRQELALFGPGQDLESAAQHASRVFTDDFAGLDVTILGMGGDAHIASHFPELQAEGAGAVQVVRQSPKPPSERLTLSLPVLASAGLNLIYACGEGKRDALKATLAGDVRAPASALERFVIVTDLTGLG